MTTPQARLFLAVPLATLPGSSVVEQVTVNHLVVGSIPTRAAISTKEMRILRIFPKKPLSGHCAVLETPSGLKLYLASQVNEAALTVVLCKIHLIAKDCPVTVPVGWTYHQRPVKSCG